MKKQLTQDMYQYIKDHESENLDSVDIVEAFSYKSVEIVLDVLGDLQKDGHVECVHSSGIQYKYIIT